MGREGFAFQAVPSKLLPPGRDFGASNPSFVSSGVWFKIKKVLVGTRTCISIVGREGFAFQAAPQNCSHLVAILGLRILLIPDSVCLFKIKKVLALTRTCISIMGREGFEPSKAEPSDLQSDVIDHYTTSPENSCL